MTRACAACGTSFETRSTAAKYCSDRCRKRVNRAGRLTHQAPAPAPVPVDPATSLAGRTRVELQAAGLVDGSSGAAALILAERIDSRQDTGSAVAALVREYRTVMAELLGAQPQALNPHDELRALRERRRAG